MKSSAARVTVQGPDDRELSKKPAVSRRFYGCTGVARGSLVSGVILDVPCRLSDSGHRTADGQRGAHPPLHRASAPRPYWGDLI